MARSLAGSVLLVGVLALVLPGALGTPAARGDDKKKEREEAERKRIEELLYPKHVKELAKDSVAALLEKLGDKDRPVREDARSALWMKLRAKAGLAELKAVLKGTNDKRADVRGDALMLLSLFEKVGHEAIELQIVPAILRGLKDKEPVVRRAAVFSSSAYGPYSKDIVTTMLPMVKEQDWPKGLHGVAELAVEKLCNPHANYAKGREVVFAIGKDKKADFRLRRAAVSALGYLGRSDPKWVPKVVPMLTAYLKDQDEPLRVRYAAVSGLTRLRKDAKGAVPAIRELLASPGLKDPKDARGMRQTMIHLLGVIGPGAKDAVPDLVKVLKDPNSDGSDRLYAVNGLGGIGPGAKEALPYLKSLVIDKKKQRLGIKASQFQRGLALAIQKIQAKE